MRTHGWRNVGWLLVLCCLHLLKFFPAEVGCPNHFQFSQMSCWWLLQLKKLEWWFFIRWSWIMVFTWLKFKRKLMYIVYIKQFQFKYDQMFYLDNMIWWILMDFVYSLLWCRVDVVVFVIWELVILAFLVFSVVSLYFRHIQLAFILVCITVLLLLCMKITKQVRLARKKKRRMLLPLSM